ncbi:aurora kinase A and ninein-interacting protein isoform X1 [Xyrichtys novacula]|uniref:Aurora kinase A and ninein-interacting protein isoform X1 n=1 Tax=Xyrichtys novacula TaxID=13765 RepID=A0AAV1HER1_XYRNO|nr:aurora kinase A and ninein-interacting protein isoform X1 [Xyrichtys novacula]
MKTSKPAPKTHVQEECGVWLDTVQLKGNAKKKRLARPISKLLNPFAGGGGYNLAVALNFTQTKMEMPKTKQSSISTFFTAQRRVLNKMSTSDPVIPPSSPNPSMCVLTSHTPVTSGKKRRLATDLNSEPELDHEWKHQTMTEPDKKVCQEQGSSCTPHSNMYWDFEEQAEEINPPQSKRRLILTTSLPEDSQPPPQAWSQDPLFTCSQYTEDKADLTYQENRAEEKYTDSEPSFLHNPISEEAFGALMEGTTSTQKDFKHSKFLHIDDEKENYIVSSSRSPSKHTAFAHIQSLSNHRNKTETKTASPRRNIPSCLWEKPEKPQSPNSESKWKKPRVPPLKKQAAQQSFRAADEDSLAMLFTQDSEGFRVIAHRGLPVRSPLKDQSNTSSGVVRSSDFESLEEEEDEMLLTQDSQGNMVIKH